MEAWSGPLGSVGDRSDDARIGTATADIAAHPKPDFIRRTCMAFCDAAYSRHDLSGGAEAALQTVALDERSLERMKLAIRFKALDRLDLSPLMHRSQRQAGDDTPAVEKDGASTAGALIAPFLRAGEIERLAQHIEQRAPGIDFELMRFAVDY
ncbi:hypothetical protein V1278_004628 [Bradyrhizobium sp. AZCC 1577]